MVGSTGGGSDVGGEPGQAQCPVGGRPSPAECRAGACGAALRLLPFSQHEQHSRQLTVREEVWTGPRGSRGCCVKRASSPLCRGENGNLSGRDSAGFEQGLAGPQGTALGDGAGEGPSW